MKLLRALLAAGVLGAAFSVSAQTLPPPVTATMPAATASVPMMKPAATASAPATTPAATGTGDEVADRLAAAKVAYEKDVAAARRALVGVITVRQDAAADAGDLAQVQLLEAAKTKATRDGTLPDELKDDVILAAQKQMKQAIDAAGSKLAAAYHDAVVAYTRARRIAEAQAIQDELNALGFKPAVTDSVAAVTATAPPAKEVRPVTDAGFTPPALPEGTTQVALAGPATAVAVGGSGRYLILQIGKLQQLAVFDVSQVKVVKYLPMPTNNLVFAAGAKKLFVGLKDLRQIQRWDLTKLELELTVPAPDPVGAMAMGACATTPLLMVGDGTKRYWVINPMTLKGEAFPSQRWGGGGGGAWGPVNLHVSFDGTTSVACGGGWAGIEVGSLSAAGKVVNVHSGSYVNGDTLIAGNGALVFPSQGGILRSDLTSKVTGIDGTPFPADDPAFSLAFRNDKGKPVLVLYANADPRPLVTLQDLPEITKDSALPLEQRIHLIPRAKALVTVGEGGDHLVLRKFDLAESLEAEGIDYLFVESPPVISVDKGMHYTYQMKVRSKKGGVKTELQSGPKGMTVSKAGLVQWTAPTKVDDPHPTVIIQVTDDSGQTIFHTFSINVIDPAASKTGPR